MTNATNPATIGLTIANATVRTWCDNPPSVTTITSQATNAAGTAYTAWKLNGSNYQVPASTNFRFFGLESILVVATGSTASTLYQIGYSDDGAGTNFVSLLDITSLMSFITGYITAGKIQAGFPTGALTVPASKYPTIKITGGSALTVLFTLIGIQTN